MNCSRNVLYVDQRPVAATEPPAAWLGGKRHLAKRICHVLASTPHDAYVEPFIGMGGVFLRRRVRPHVEVINDISGDIVTLFRVLQRFPEALLRELRWRPAMRSEFARLNEARDCDLLDIERAARFLYLQTLAFGGKMAGYDRPGTLFYLDPPYWGGEGDYGAGVFMRGDFQRMADKLRAIEGKFLLSINDRPEIRDLFAWADIEAVQTTYTIAGGDKASTAAELLIGKGVKLAPAAAQASLF